MDGGTTRELTFVSEEMTCYFIVIVVRTRQRDANEFREDYVFADADDLNVLVLFAFDGHNAFVSSL